MISGWIVVAFLLTSDGQATFFASPRMGDEFECEQSARDLITKIDQNREEITIFASQCIPVDDRFYPSEDQT